MSNLPVNPLKQHRVKLGLSRVELAGLLGVSYQAVHQWESGATMPAVSPAPDIATALQLSVSEVLSLIHGVAVRKAGAA